MSVDLSVCPVNKGTLWGISLLRDRVDGDPDRDKPALRTVSLRYAV